MPLKPGQKTQLALRMASARFLDVKCATTDDGDILAELKGAASVVESRAATATSRVKNDEAVSAYIETTAASLAEFLLAPDVAECQQALNVLSHSIAGDGTRLNSKTVPHCASGVLELACLIEANVRDEASKLGVKLAPVPYIRYRTAITGNSKTVHPFSVAGAADISPSQPEVSITLLNAALSGTDINQLSYVLHHEIVCHAFQGYKAGGQRENAPAASAWSEGWMDMYAYDLAEEWVATGPKAWVPARGEDAIGQIRAYHDHRYLNPTQLDTSAATKRRQARNSYRALAHAYLGSNTSFSKEEAGRMAERFSLMANSHPEATSHELDEICAIIGAVLLDSEDAQKWSAIAEACSRFIADENLLTLKADLWATLN